MIDKAFSIKHEGHLNKNNIIFKNTNIVRLVKDMHYVNNQLGVWKSCDECGVWELEDDLLYWEYMNKVDQMFWSQHKTGEKLCDDCWRD
jgi:hypothetical protein|tara:strand:+ start:970 stop:1236 length:267 start_codon:yes stop_codon:yes gene_type:complete